jgi:hypothetical protein
MHFDFHKVNSFAKLHEPQTSLSSGHPEGIGFYPVVQRP